MSLPRLETPRLVMRPWSADDVDELHRMWIDPQVLRYLWDGEAITRERAAATVEAALTSAAHHGVGLWCLLRKPARALAGFCGFRFIADSPDIELLYGLKPEYWGQGLATEASRAALRHGFEAGLFTKVYARTDPPNRASVRVIERLGMEFEREALAGPLPTLIYSLRREAFSLTD